PLRLRNWAASFSPRAPSWRCSDNSLEREKRLRHRFERSAMDRTRPVFMKFEEMQFCAITLVLAKAIFGKAGAKITHHCIARHLRDHARCRNAQANAVPVNNRRLRPRKRRYRKTINEHVIR